MSFDIGVVAIQGDVSEHVRAIRRATADLSDRVQIHRVRTAGTVPACDALVLPGGESTTISRGLQREGIADELIEHVEADRPLLATCAGLIVTARDVGDPRVDELQLLDATVERNAFGRQRDSFETALDVRGFRDPVPAVFIRAPVITDVGSEVEVLARHDGTIVAVRQNSVVGLSFHPELTPDSRLHQAALALDRVDKSDSRATS